MLFVGQHTADDLVSLKKGRILGCVKEASLWVRSTVGGKIPETKPIPAKFTVKKQHFPRYSKKEYLPVHRFQHQEVFRDRYPNGGTNRKEKSSGWFQLEVPGKTRHFIIQDKSSRYCTASRTGGLVPNQPSLWPLLDLIQLRPALWSAAPTLVLEVYTSSALVGSIKTADNKNQFIRPKYR